MDLSEKNMKIFVIFDAFLSEYDIYLKVLLKNYSQQFIFNESQQYLLLKKADGYTIFTLYFRHVCVAQQ